MQMLQERIEDLGATVEDHEATYEHEDRSLVVTLQYKLDLDDDDAIEGELIRILSRENEINLEDVDTKRELVSNDRLATITIPPGTTASESDISVEFTEGDSINLLNGDTVVSRFAYTFNPAGTRFSQPVEIEIQFDVDELRERIRERGASDDDLLENVELAQIRNNRVEEFLQTRFDLNNGTATTTAQELDTLAIVHHSCKGCEVCKFEFKTYESTWRIRLPTGTNREDTISIDDKEFSYRNQDTDCGCSRPSYTGRFGRGEFQGGQVYEVVVGDVVFDLRADPTGAGWQSCSSRPYEPEEESSSSSTWRSFVNKVKFW